MDSYDRMTVRELKELLRRSGAKVFGKEAGAGPSAREFAARGRSRRTPAIVAVGTPRRSTTRRIAG